MMKQVFKLREDGSFDFIDSILVEVDAIPEGYALPDESKHYNSDTGLPLSDAELKAIHNTPQPKNEVDELRERLSLAEKAIDELIFGGVL